MDCPICHVKLQMTERQGVEIDYCPQCRGIWLDRGELDKIIEKSNENDMQVRRTEYPQSAYTNEQQNYRHPEHNDKHYDKHDDHYGSNYSGYNKHRKRSFLSDLFEFGDD